ncbi:MAG: SGNH/GDSL hydrolase family protein [Lachnospiraceae bacterium]|nr:SGNH/GDSL hydrolase family protein [Candidatus Colinaster equi]
MKKGKMPEAVVRLMCFLLGILLTVAAVLIKDRVIAGMTEEIAESIETVATAEETTIPVETATVDYESVAEEKYEKMQADAEASKPEEEQKKNEKDEFIIDGKTSKLNWNMDYPPLDIEGTLAENEAEESSYDYTMSVNAFDRKVIENSKIDFSDVKITIMGDSITEGSNLSDEEKPIYNYPKILQEILGCKEVVNLGIGGSVVSSCASSFAMVDRWDDIPEDSDIVIIFGGTNDCLYMNKWDFGELEYDKRMKNDTFCGDLDEMCSAMKWKFHDNMTDRYVKLIYVNPMSTILNDGVYATDPGNMVAQVSFAEAINEIVPDYDFAVIDLYNSNFLNSHDEQINHQFTPDGVHPNTDGYRILAEHLASEIIQRIKTE